MTLSTHDPYDVRKALDEQFVEVPGYPNYLVSNYGYVINKIRNTEVASSVGPNGQLKVSLWQAGKSRTFYVNRLVAECFLLDFDPYYTVGHSNNDKRDNAAHNLYMTYRVAARGKGTVVKKKRLR